MWSVVRAHDGSLIGLLGGPAGPVVRSLVVDEHGLVRAGRRHPTPDATAAIALGLAGAAPVLLGSVEREETVPILDAGLDLFDEVAGELFPGEPARPTVPDLATTLRILPSVHDLSGRAVPVPALAPDHGLLTAALGRWTVHQHGPDEEADHLSMLTVRLDDRDVLVLDDLDAAGPARLTGRSDAPVLTVADGLGRLRVHALGSNGSSHVLPSLADEPTTTVVPTSDGVTATSTDRAGRLLVSRLRAGAWEPAGALAGTSGVTAVVPVAGASAVLTATGDGVRHVALEGAHR